MMAGLVLCTVCWCCYGCEHAHLSDQVSASVMAVNLCAWGVYVCAALSSKQWRLARCRAAAVVCFCVGCWGGAMVLLVELTEQLVHLSWVLVTSTPGCCASSCEYCWVACRCHFICL